MTVKKIILFLFVLIFVPAFAILFRKARLNNAQQGITDIGQADSFEYSRYYTGNGKIYYLKVGSGYFLLNKADIATFSTLNTVNDRGTMAKDAKHVYYKTRIVANVEPADVVYLRNNFYKAGARAFYGDTLLKISDTASFHFLKGYYAADDKNLFWKNHLVPGADVQTLKFDNFPDEYMLDKGHVYYNGEVIKGAQPAQFTFIAAEDDQWHTQYAFDGVRYFFGKYPILADGDERKHLTLLTIDKGFVWHGIFYQGITLYCYDAGRHKLLPMGNRDNDAPFRMIDRGLFTDGKHIYFTFSKWNKSGGRMPHYTGHTTGICIVEDADARNFKEAGKYVTNNNVEGTLYKSGVHTYFHPRYSSDSNYSPGLMRLIGDGTIEKLPTGGAFSKNVSNYDGPSIFSWEFYKDLLIADPVYDDY
jgi:hypothetical protein